MLANHTVIIMLNTKNNEFGMTNLHHAAMQGDLSRVELLIKQGVPCNRLNDNSQPPIFCSLFLPINQSNALIQNKVNIFRLLKTADSTPLNHQDLRGDSILHLMAMNGFVDLMREQIQEDTQLAFRCNHHDHYPIHTAILNNQLEASRLLLGIDGVAYLKDSQGRTPLHYAAQYGTKKMVELCSKATPNIDVRDESYQTPLLSAAERGNLEAVQCLIQNGADAQLTDTQGYTILHFAVLSGNPSLVSWIQDNTSIDITQLDKQGQTALDLEKQLLVERARII